MVKDPPLQQDGSGSYMRRAGILMINAWELLLKARVMKENGGKLPSVYARDSVKLKNGKYGKRRKVRLTRYGSPHTIGIVEACNLVQGYKKDNLEGVAAAKITALLDIRGHATHFVASNASRRKTLAELSLAAVMNYIIASQNGSRLHTPTLTLLPSQSLSRSAKLGRKLWRKHRLLRLHVSSLI